MTLISSIISDAFREGNILPLGVSPSTNQSTEALRLINAVFSAIFGDEAGESLTDWPLGSYGREYTDTVPNDYTLTHPFLNRRLIVSNTAAMTVYLSPYPQDGARMGIIDPLARLATVPVTLNANGRTIENAATVVLNTASLTREWFYRADLGDWVRLTSKVAADEMPFPTDFDNFFITTLAMRINPRYGRSMDEQSIEVYKSERRKFISRYLQSAPLEILDDISWPFMSTQGYGNQREFSSNQAFNRGGYWWG